MHVIEAVRIAAAAWAKVKPKDDPDYNGCSLTFREKLVAQVEGVARTGSAYDDFERAAKAIIDGTHLKAPEESFGFQAEATTKKGKKASAKAPAKAAPKKTRK